MQIGRLFQESTPASKCEFWDAPASSVESFHQPRQTKRAVKKLCTRAATKCRRSLFKGLAKSIPARCPLLPTVRMTAGDSLHLTVAISVASRPPRGFLEQIQALHDDGAPFLPNPGPCTEYLRYPYRALCHDAVRLGFQAVAFAVFTKVYASQASLLPDDAFEVWMVLGDEFLRAS